MASVHRRTVTFGLGGGGRGEAVILLPEKKLHNPQKRELYIRTKIAVKAKTLPIPTFNETIIIPKTQRNSDF